MRNNLKPKTDDSWQLWICFNQKLLLIDFYALKYERIKVRNTHLRCHRNPYGCGLRGSFLFGVGSVLKDNTQLDWQEELICCPDKLHKLSGHLDSTGSQWEAEITAGVCPQEDKTGKSLCAKDEGTEQQMKHETKSQGLTISNFIHTRTW